MVLFAKVWNVTPSATDFGRVSVYYRMQLSVLLKDISDFQLEPTNKFFLAYPTGISARLTSTYTKGYTTTLVHDVRTSFWTLGRQYFYVIFRQTSTA